MPISSKIETTSGTRKCLAGALKVVSRGSSSWRLVAAFFPFVLLYEFIFRELMSTVFVVSVSVF